MAQPLKVLVGPGGLPYSSKVPPIWWDLKNKSWRSKTTTQLQGFVWLRRVPSCILIKFRRSLISPDSLIIGAWIFLQGHFLPGSLASARFLFVVRFDSPRSDKSKTPGTLFVSMQTCNIVSQERIRGKRALGLQPRP